MTTQPQNFACIVADPPWVLPIGKTRTASGDRDWDKSLSLTPLPYPTLSEAEIIALRPPSAADAHLYLWTVNRHVEAAFRVARAWGFTTSTLLTWAKAPRGLGLGGTFVNSSEFILFCRRGSLPAKRRVDRTTFSWKRGKHSVKPSAFLDIVESVSPGPYLEMFARRTRPGWSHFGNELEGGLEIRATLPSPLASR